MGARVLFVSRTWVMGGAQTILLSAIRSLPKRGFRILVAPYDSGTRADAEFTVAAISAGAEMTGPVHWSGYGSWYAARRSLSDIVQKHRIDLVHSHDNFSNTLVGLNRSRLRLPALATAFGWWELNLKLKAFYAFERRVALPRFDGIYTVSHHMAGKLRAGGVPNRLITVIHTGIDASAWSPQGRRDRMRAQLGIPRDALAIGSVGRISREKGHIHLLQAVGRLLPEFPRLYILLGGTGPAVQPLRELASRMGLADRLVMPGYVDDPAGTLEALDVVALPSVLEEGFPTASIEGQAMGIPVVASDIGGTRETLVDGKTGRLCRPSDTGALADALRPLLVDVSLRARMGSAARERIVRDFSLAAMMEQISSLYERTLSHPAKVSTPPPD